MRRPLALAVTAILLAGVGTARAATSASSSGPDNGPRLTVTSAEAAQALHCTGDLASSRRRGLTPILTLHGTTSDARANFSWNWDKAFDAQQRAHCDLDLFHSGNGDIQTSAEYVVYAIRTMDRAAHGEISLLGHSQGGEVGRWALKYWPDTRAMVDDYVGLSSGNHGTEALTAQCESTKSCFAAYWQQRSDAAFIKALNTGPETWPGISYTVISTTDDEVVVPNTLAYLKPAKNVANMTVQQLCPTEVVDHFGMAYDNAAYLLGMDAFTHAGPTVLSRVGTSTCGQPLMPSVDKARFAGDSTSAVAQTAESSATAPQLSAEPPLRCYATHTCRGR